MNDAVDRLIVERQAMDHGFGGGLLLSIFAHLTMLGAAAAAPYLRPKEPPIHVADVFAVPMPPGGGGPTNPEPPAAGPETPDAEPAVAKPEPPATLIKPPTKKDTKTKGMPLPDAKTVKKSKKDEPSKPIDAPNPPSNKAKPASGGSPAGKGTNAATPGLDFGPQGPGVPGGTDWLGDWYMAGVQRKIWSFWNAQIKADFNQPIAVRFTIVQDGTVTDVQVTQSSGATLLDMAAQRAVYSSQPFGPIPKNYGMDRITIQATFKPISQ